MIFKNLCIFVIWAKVASTLEGLKPYNLLPRYLYDPKLNQSKYYIKHVLPLMVLNKDLHLQGHTFKGKIFPEYFINFSAIHLRPYIESIMV